MGAHTSRSVVKFCSSRQMTASSVMSVEHQRLVSLQSRVTFPCCINTLVLSIGGRSIPSQALKRAAIFMYVRIVVANVVSHFISGFSWIASLATLPVLGPAAAAFEEEAACCSVAVQAFGSCCTLWCSSEACASLLASVMDCWMAIIPEPSIRAQVVWNVGEDRQVRRVLCPCSASELGQVLLWAVPAAVTETDERYSCVALRSDGPTPRGQRVGALLRTVSGRDWTPKMIGWMRARTSDGRTIHPRGAETAPLRRRRDELGLEWTSTE